MKNFKIIVSCIILVLLIVIYFQNKVYFMTKQSLTIDLYFDFLKFHTAQIYNICYFAGCFIIGFLLCFFIKLPKDIKMKRYLKASQKYIAQKDSEIDEHKQTIEKQNQQLNSLKKATATEQTSD